jgi:uncharacterized protein (DUF433 family)
MTAEQKVQLADVVWVDPERMSGEPCFKGTRVPVQALIDHIEGNSTLERLPVELSVGESGASHPVY